MWGLSLEIVPENVSFFLILGLIFAVIFFLFQHFFLRLQSYFIPQHAALDYVKRLDWDNRVLSHFHSCVMSLVGWYSFYAYPEYRAGDPFFSPVSTSFLEAFSFGYFVSELIYLAAYPTMVKGFQYWMYIVHHVAGLMLIVAFIVMPEAYSIGFVICGVVESSGPFANQIYFLKAFGFRDSPIFVLNGIMLLVAWVTCRWLIGGVFAWYILIRSYDIGAPDRPFYYWFLIAEQCLGTLLNAVWGYKIVVGLVSVALGKSVEAIDSKEKKKKIF